ncbi:nuclear transport factor 2 family protein (plasmid) [Salipiger sp. H15]|uniref:Nuclear transport factor 2 family protein n=1 Tax=Alloyangia sp. H15 TaxID=3029062 RepID=A0AAU8AQE2_9RHOB
MNTALSEVSRQREDMQELRSLVENWVIWRDAGFWEKFRTVWHDDGRMMATWTQGTADEFIAMNRAGWDKGVSILHFLGGSNIEVAGNRAITQTKMTISQRAEVHGVTVDVVCTGRFHDFWERRAGRWGLCLRQPIYEKDRMDPVDPAARLALDPEVLARYPVGYCHLAYLQSSIGYPVKTDMPGLRGEKVAALYACGESWLAGRPVEWEGHVWGR